MKPGGKIMKTQWSKYSTIFIAALVVIMAGISITEPLAAAQTNEQDDVQSTAVPGQLAPRLQNLGNHKFPVTTNSARAQLFINQGLMLAYGFNHAEAERSFHEAARLDPNCAMAYWGMALVMGPNINMAMSPEAEQPAYETIRKAVALKNTASEREQAAAVEKRFRKAWKRSDVTLTASRFMDDAPTTVAVIGATISGN